jgi:hypothetical protein
MRIALLSATMAALTLAAPAAAQNDRSGRSAPHTYVGGDLLGLISPPTITAYRSQANFITYRIGVTVGIR